MSDPYGTLGVRPDASDEEIAKAYKRLAKRYHPDLNPNNSAAAEQMGRVNQAYDEIKRLRQSGNRQNSRPSRSASDPFTAYYQGYRRSTTADYAEQYRYHRRGSTFRVAMAIMLAILLLRLFAVLMSGTTPYERLVHGVPAASDEPRDFYAFYHLYP